MLLMTDLRKNCVPSKTKYVSVEKCNITRIKKAKTLVNYISCDCKCRFDIAHHAMPIKKGIMINANVCVKSITCNSWNPNTCICENTRYLKTIVDD